MVLPALVDGDGPVLFIVAIMEYLDETHPQPPLSKEPRRTRAAPGADRRLRTPIPCWCRGCANISSTNCDKPARLKSIQNWIGAALKALETTAARKPPLLPGRRHHHRRHLPGEPGRRRDLL